MCVSSFTFRLVSTGVVEIAKSAVLAHVSFMMMLFVIREVAELFSILSQKFGSTNSLQNCRLECKLREIAIIIGGFEPLMTKNQTFLTKVFKLQGSAIITLFSNVF